jgi:hypothetical protein
LAFRCQSRRANGEIDSSEGTGVPRVPPSVINSLLYQACPLQERLTRGLGVPLDSSLMAIRKRPSEQESLHYVGRT